jgi:hypothetical protein
MRRPRPTDVAMQATRRTATRRLAHHLRGLRGLDAEPQGRLADARPRIPVHPVADKPERALEAGDAAAETDRRGDAGDEEDRDQEVGQDADDQPCR